jgi:hypothetical protein
MNILDRQELRNSVARKVFLSRLTRILDDVDKLAVEVVALRDDSEGDDKSDFRAIGRRLELAYDQVELAIERCKL